MKDDFILLMWLNMFCVDEYSILSDYCVSLFGLLKSEILPQKQKDKSGADASF